VAYGTIASEVPGELIAAAVAVGRAEKGNFGVIMECSGRCSRAEIEERVKSMVTEGFTLRGLSPKGVQTASIEWRVRQVGAVIAAVPLWYA